MFDSPDPKTFAESLIFYNVPVLAKWVGALLVAEWLKTPESIHVLFFLMGLDMLVGVLVAFKDKQLSSDVMRRGIIKKVITLIIILTAHILERLAGLELGLENIAAIGYCINEIISIVENSAKAGVPIPTEIVEALLTVKKLRLKSASPKDLESLTQDNNSGKLDSSVLNTLKKENDHGRLESD